MTNGIGQIGGQPILILPEGTLRNRGKDAQRNNIAAARAVADTVRTTLGPKGMDKMLVDSLGDVVITNDGATILNEMQIEHPSAKMMVEVANSRDSRRSPGDSVHWGVDGIRAYAADLADMTKSGEDGPGGHFGGGWRG